MERERERGFHSPPVPHLVGNRCFVVRVLFRVGNRYRCRLWVFLVSSICVIDSTFVGEMIVSRQVSGEVFLLFYSREDGD